MNKEIVEETNLILSDYTKLVKRFWDLYENIDDDQAQLLTKAGADKWLKYAFTLSIDELWHEAISWELTKEDLEMMKIFVQNMPKDLFTFSFIHM